MVKNTVLESFIIQMAAIIKVNLKKINDMERVFILMKMDTNMTVDGTKVSNMDTEFYLIKMEKILFMVNGQMEK